MLQLIYIPVPPLDGTLKICANLKETVQLVYIVTDANCNGRRFSNVSIMFPSVSVMYLIVVVSIMGLFSH